MSLAHRPLPHRKHDVFLHLVDILLQLLIFLDVQRLAAPIVVYPEGDDGTGDGDGKSKVDPEADGDRL